MRSYKEQMKNYTNYLLYLIANLMLASALTAQPEWDEGVYIKDTIYNKSIKTCILSPLETLLEMPIINLSKSEQLRFQFDDLHTQARDYVYRVQHCNADWTVSDLYENQYMEGFSENYIDNYEFSFNTKTSYVHYELVFPNKDVSVTKTGNYVLTVYDAEETEIPIVTKRFMVYDDGLLLGVNVKQATFAKNRYSDHEVDVIVNFTNEDYVYPLQDVKVYIYQGHQWANYVSDLKPSFIDAKRLEYDYEDESSFAGGNEYRFFDTKSVRFYTERVYKIIQGEMDRVMLYADVPWGQQAYSYNPDIEGYYVPNIMEKRDVNTQADYVQVDFCLKQKPFIEEGNLYIYGALTNWDIDKEGRMEYNHQSGCYETSMVLKQGYYNYTYMFVSAETGEVSQAPVDGSFYQTSQDYHVLVYLFDHHDGYDRLLGVSKISTKDRF